MGPGAAAGPCLPVGSGRRGPTRTGRPPPRSPHWPPGPTGQAPRADLGCSKTNNAGSAWAARVDVRSQVPRNWLAKERPTMLVLANGRHRANNAARQYNTIPPLLICPPFGALDPFTGCISGRGYIRCPAQTSIRSYIRGHSRVVTSVPTVGPVGPDAGGSAAPTNRRGRVSSTYLMGGARPVPASTANRNPASSAHTCGSGDRPAGRGEASPPSPVVVGLQMTTMLVAKIGEQRTSRTSAPLL